MSQHLAVELLSSYVDEEVTPAQLRLVEDHLGGCPECRRNLAGLRAVAASVGRLEAVAPPPTLSAAVERRIRIETLDESPTFRFEGGLKRWLGQPVLAPAFATVLALAAILYLFAFGVSKGSRHPTRVVVASAPNEEGKESSRRQRDLVADPVSKTSLDQIGAADEQASQDVTESPGVFESDAPPPAGELNASVAGEADAVVSSEATTPPELTSPASAGAVGRLADGRQNQGSKLDQVQPERTEIASTEEVVLADAAGPAEQELEKVTGARAEARKRSATVARSSRAIADATFASEAPEIRELAGRRFVEEAGVWVEVGLEGQKAVELIDVRLASSLLDHELAVFQDLERVRLRIDGRIVEVIYPATETQD